MLRSIFLCAMFISCWSNPDSLSCTGTKHIPIMTVAVLMRHREYKNKANSMLHLNSFRCFTGTVKFSTWNMSCSAWTIIYSNWNCSAPRTQKPMLRIDMSNYLLNSHFSNITLASKQVILWKSSDTEWKGSLWYWLRNCYPTSSGTLYVFVNFYLCFQLKGGPLK